MSDGASEGAHRQAAAEQWAKLGKPRLAAAALPDAPPFPVPLTYLWEHFVELCLGLTQNGMAPPVVSWESLRAWATFMRHELEPWEAQALVRLGFTRAAVMAEAKDNGAQGQDRSR